VQDDEGEVDDDEEGGKGLEGTISRLGTGLTQLVAGGQKESTATVAERQVRFINF
jgi:hypothetical protein